MAKIETNAGTIKMTFEWSEGDERSFITTRKVLRELATTLEHNRCDTIALNEGYEIHLIDLEDAIDTLDHIMDDMPSETEIW